MTITYLPEVPITSIVPHPANPRRDLDDIGDLADSVRAQGILEPLLLANLNGTQHRLIAGHRRLAAAKAAGLTTVPARLDESLDTPDKQLAAMLVENTQRTDLSPAEEAAAYAQLVAFPGMTQAKAAKATGRSAKTVRGRLALAKLPEKTLERIHTGQITLHDAEALVEFAGTPEYDELSRAAGGTNFGFTLQRARERAARRASLEVVLKYCAEQGWEVANSRPRNAVSVLSSWRVPRDMSAALAELTEPPYLLVQSTYDPLQWELYHVGSDDEDDQGDDEPVLTRSPEHEQAIAERAARAADVETARTVRAEWLKGRMGNLVVKDHERVLLLRLLVDDWIRNSGDWNDDVEAFVGMPPVPEDAKPWDDSVVEARRAWAAGLSEMQAWKALIALTFDVVRCGSTWEDSHVPSIRVAAALGYGMSDLETDLITPTTEEETTA